MRGSSPRMTTKWIKTTGIRKHGRSAIGYYNERYRGFALHRNTAIAIGYCNDTYRAASYLQKFVDRAKSNSFKQPPVVGTRCGHTQGGKHGLDDPDSRRNLHRPRDQRLSAGRVLILQPSDRFDPAKESLEIPERIDASWGVFPLLYSARRPAVASLSGIATAMYVGWRGPVTRASNRAPRRASR